MNTFRTAYIYVRDSFAGLLSETDEGYIFTYDPAYLSDPNASAVSLTMPLSEKPYVSKTLFPFFDGLVPEGWLLEVVSRNWKLDPQDRFGLLLVACRDGIGNVSVFDRPRSEVTE
jgi:serine/threonine-protein kinase HipA